MYSYDLLDQKERKLLYSWETRSSLSLLNMSFDFSSLNHFRILSPVETGQVRRGQGWEPQPRIFPSPLYLRSVFTLKCPTLRTRRRETDRTVLRRLRVLTVVPFPFLISTDAPHSPDSWTPLVSQRRYGTGVYTWGDGVVYRIICKVRLLPFVDFTDQIGVW